jgi:hypothetical protein
MPKNCIRSFSLFQVIFFFVLMKIYFRALYTTGPVEEDPLQPANEVPQHAAHLVYPPSQSGLDVLRVHHGPS